MGSRRRKQTPKIPAGKQKAVIQDPVPTLSPSAATKPEGSESEKRLHRRFFRSIGGGGVVVALTLAAATSNAPTIAVWLYLAAIVVACVSGWFLFEQYTGIKRWLGFALSCVIATCLIFWLMSETVSGPLRLNRREKNLYTAILKTAIVAPNLTHIVCAEGQEETCSFANTFIPLFQRAGWKIAGPEVERVRLARPTQSILIVNYGPPLIHPQNLDEGVYTKVKVWTQSVKTAFALIGVTDLEEVNDNTLPETDLRIYFGSIPKRNIDPLKAIMADRNR